MTQPWLSVLIPTYNGASYLSATLDSIVLQDEADIECIIVDDGSTDATLKIVESYKNQLHIQVLQHARRGNWVASTNEGLISAHGEYVCFLHQDDIWLQNRIKQLKKILQNHLDVDIILHPSYFINAHNQVLGNWKCPLPAYPKVIQPDVILEKLLIQNFIAIPAPLFKRKLALEVGMLQESLWYTADWDFWLKIMSKSKAIYYPQPLTGFRIHPESQTLKRSSLPDGFREQMKQVAAKHLTIWEAPARKKKQIEKISFFSCEVNALLAIKFHGAIKVTSWKMIKSFIGLGPVNLYLYVQSSRIVERVVSRLKANLSHKS